jgi:hypothetical protein
VILASASEFFFYYFKSEEIKSDTVRAPLLIQTEETYNPGEIGDPTPIVLQYIYNNQVLIKI